MDVLEGDMTFRFSDFALVSSCMFTPPSATTYTSKVRLGANKNTFAVKLVVVLI